MKKTIFVLGAGNGCGNRVAEKFGKNDFRVDVAGAYHAITQVLGEEFSQKNGAILLCWQRISGNFIRSEMTARWYTDGQ